MVVAVLRDVAGQPVVGAGVVLGLVVRVLDVGQADDERRDEQRRHEQLDGCREARSGQWIPTMPAHTQFDAPAPLFQMRDATASCSDLDARYAAGPVPPKQLPGAGDDLVVARGPGAVGRQVLPAGLAQDDRVGDGPAAGRAQCRAVADGRRERRRQQRRRPRRPRRQRGRRPAGPRRARSAGAARGCAPGWRPSAARWALRALESADSREESSVVHAGQRLGAHLGLRGDLLDVALEPGQPLDRGVGGRLGGLR